MAAHQLVSSATSESGSAPIRARRSFAAVLLLPVIEENSLLLSAVFSNFAREVIRVAEIIKFRVVTTRMRIDATPLRARLRRPRRQYLRQYRPPGFFRLATTL